MNATITVDDGLKQLEQVFAAELKSTVNERASYSVLHQNKQTTFTIKAKDIVALRATINAITKQLVVFEKMKSLGN